MSTVAHINPQMLTWARERQGLALHEVAEKPSLQHVSAWESGQTQPTMNQLRVLSHLYRRPSALFFFSSPPSDKEKTRDFRSLKDRTDSPLHPETLTELRLCESRRRSALELAEALGVETRSRLPALDWDNIEESARMVREALSIPDRPASKDAKAVLQLWIERLEQANILVFRSVTLGGYNPSFRQIRGSSYYSSEYPWILLNSQEHPHGQLFTLGHELAHLLLHNGGMCTLDEHDSSDEAALERRCNAIAAALLMPRERVLQMIGWKGNILVDSAAVDHAVYLIQISFQTSREAAARRLVSVGATEQAQYLRIREEQIQALTKERESKDDSGGNGKYYYRRVLAWNGGKYTGLVIEGLHQGKLSLGAAAEALRTKVAHLETLRSELYG